MNKRHKFLSRIEEKYVFNLSRSFWHALVLLAGVAMLGGFVAFGWGVVPARKANVAKESYPPVITVAWDELTANLAMAERTVPDGVPTAPGEREGRGDRGESGYRAAVSALRALLPAAPWEDEGTWVYPYGLEMYQTTQFENARRWEITKKGLHTTLTDRFQGLSAASFKDKTQVVDAYCHVLAVVPKASRAFAFDAMGVGLLGTPDEVASILEGLKAPIKAFDGSQVTALTKLLVFAASDPKDAVAMESLVADFIPNFPKASRLQVLPVVTGGASQYFDGNVAIEKEATDGFLDHLDNVPAGKFTPYLSAYFVLFAEKNRDRLKNIAEIESRFSQRSAEAETAYQAETATKSLDRMVSLSVIGGAIVVTSLVAMFLVLLSMQRSLRAIALSTTGRGLAGTASDKTPMHGTVKDMNPSQSAGAA